jgi:hypothetical protein
VNWQVILRYKDIIACMFGMLTRSRVGKQEGR